MKKIIMGVLTILLLFINVTTLAIADSDWYHDDSSTKLILFPDDKTYKIGDEVTIMLYMFDKAIPVDASEEPIITLFSYEGYNRISNEPNDMITVEKKDTGVYKISFKIFTSDIEYDEFDGSEEYVSIRVKAEGIYGKDSENDFTYNIANDDVYIDVLLSDEGISIEIEFDDMSDRYSSPGDTVEFTITIKDDGLLTDDLNLEVEYKTYEYFEYYEDYEDWKIIFDIQNPSPGINKGKFIINANLEKPTNYQIRAFIDENDNGECDNDYDSETEKYIYEKRDNLYFYVYFYSIWFHELNIISTNANFEICVADIDGKAVSGIDVNLTAKAEQFVYDPVWNYTHTDYVEIYSDTKSTDILGEANFEFNYDVTDSFKITGTVGTSKKYQEFEKYIYLDDERESETEEKPSEYGFDVTENIKNDYYLKGSNVNRNYKTYLEGEILSSDDPPVYWYAFTEYDFVKADTAEIENNGQINIDFTAPNDICYIDFVGEVGEKIEGYEDNETTIDGKEYDEARDQIYIDKDELSNSKIDLKVTNLKIGGRTKVKAKTELNTENIEYIVLLWTMGEYDDSGNNLLETEWSKWDHLSGPPTYFYLSKEGNEFVGEFVIPEFMPNDVKYTVFAYVGDEYDNNYENHVTLKKGQSKSTEGYEDEGFFQMIMSPTIIIGVIITFVIIGVVAIKKKKKSKAGQFPGNYPQQPFQHNVQPGSLSSPQQQFPPFTQPYTQNSPQNIPPYPQSQQIQPPTPQPTSQQFPQFAQPLSQNSPQKISSNPQLQQPPQQQIPSFPQQQIQPAHQLS